MKLHLSTENKMLGGVCGGIAETAGVDPSFVRIGFAIALFFLHLPLLVIYLVMWALLPKRIR